MNRNLERIIKAIRDPFWLCGVLLRKISPLINDDETFIRIEYFLGRKRILHLNPPRTFNEKLQWLKLNYKDPKYTNLVDKYEVKRIVGGIIGTEYIIPTYGVWNTFDEIDFDTLPDQFVLKCTHDSGGICICEDKTHFDRKKAQRKIERCLKKKYFYEHREYPYKDVKPRIIAEKYLVDESGWQLKDYKIFCFNGHPKFVEVDYDRYVGHKLNVYDLNWNYIDFYMTSHNDPNVEIPRPKKLSKMLELAEMLAKDEIFVRVDFYSVDDKIFFGELTYHPGCGMIDFHPEEYDLKLGEMLSLPYIYENSIS